MMSSPSDEQTILDFLARLESELSDFGGSVFFKNLQYHSMQSKSIRVIVVSPLINLGSIEVDYDRKSYDDHTPYFICNWSTSFDF